MEHCFDLPAAHLLALRSVRLWQYLWRLRAAKTLRPAFAYLDEVKSAGTQAELQRRAELEAKFKSAKQVKPLMPPLPPMPPL